MGGPGAPPVMAATVIAGFYKAEHETVPINKAFIVREAGSKPRGRRVRQRQRVERGQRRHQGSSSWSRICAEEEAIGGRQSSRPWSMFTHFQWLLDHIEIKGEGGG